MSAEKKHATTITRYYIDTRSLIPENPKAGYSLPLLQTLRFEDQEAATRFFRPADKFMSLASSLLKYTLIHRRAKIPWSSVAISRTPAPHRRPYWEPISSPNSPVDDEGLEFNVTHQAGVVAIIGCTTPTRQAPDQLLMHAMDHLDLTGHHTPDLEHSQCQVRLGVDIACTDEDKRTPKDMRTQAKFDEWVDIFAEMFSDRERRQMRHDSIHVPVPEREEGVWSGSSDESSSSSETAASDHARAQRARENEARLIHLKLRRFYAYWALKEAYIKMVGEGLLASWLKELEFVDVVAPPSPLATSSRSKSHSRSRSRGASHNRAHSHGQTTHGRGASLGDFHAAAIEAAKWTSPAKAEKGMSTLLRGKKIDDVDVELVAYDEDFLLATAMRGVTEVCEESPEHAHVENGTLSPIPGGGSGPRRWIRLDIEKDIRPCAEGRCSCLD